MSEGSIKEIHEVGHIQLQAIVMKLIDFFSAKIRILTPISAFYLLSKQKNKV